MTTTPYPGTANDFLSAHAALLRESYHRLTGGDLVAPGLTPEQASQQLFEAPFALLSHSAAADPLMTYANRTGLKLFDIDWPALLVMPSRLTAEAPNRAEREHLLQRVAHAGFIDDYSGVRVSARGRRFLIRRATVWNLRGPKGAVVGQAAMFADWAYL